eukprot:CAMPEP_0172515216 /NCGR_PEP_ID=MMETSP1066-20121228/266246_1 /TAXON_ID=671091 /ORGANISM="Coscinodiscus wailesii, Strain CCMP2513" /LENGTH=120 /DNA_ID=CAMNT_0013296205 /DNA_START=116 /DNA_END=478 /DNA_ORIENTATION=+
MINSNFTQQLFSLAVTNLNASVRNETNNVKQIEAGMTIKGESTASLKDNEKQTPIANEATSRIEEIEVIIRDGRQYDYVISCRSRTPSFDEYTEFSDSSSYSDDDSDSDNENELLGLAYV